MFIIFRPTYNYLTQYKSAMTLTNMKEMDCELIAEAPYIKVKLIKWFSRHVSNILTLVMAPEEMSVDHQSQSESSSGVQKYRFASVLTDQWLFCDQVQLEWWVPYLYQRVRQSLCFEPVSQGITVQVCTTQRTGSC